MFDDKIREAEKRPSNIPRNSKVSRRLYVRLNGFGRYRTSSANLSRKAAVLGGCTILRPRHRTRRERRQHFQLRQGLRELGAQRVLDPGRDFARLARGAERFDRVEDADELR